MVTANKFRLWIFCIDIKAWEYAGGCCVWSCSKKQAGKKVEKKEGKVKNPESRKLMVHFVILTCYFYDIVQ